MLRLSAPGFRGPKDKLCKANQRSAALGISVLVHTAALAALLMLKVAPYSAPRLDVVEITLVPAQVLDSAGANSASQAVEALTPSFLSLAHPDIAARASSPHWSDNIGVDLPIPDTFRPRASALAFDTLANMLDCFTVGISARDASGRARRAHSPCASDDPLIGAHFTMPSTTYASRAGEVGADSDYRTFKTIQPIFDESLFPDKVPDANRALKSWFAGLFR